jgi:hypothetical protein
MTPTPNLRPQRMVGETFAAWRLLENGLAQPHDLAGETLPEIEDTLAVEANHGATFLILGTDTLTGGTRLHSYRIRKGKATGWNARAKRTYAYTVDRLFSVAVSAFDPVLPWRCVPGADRVGVAPFIEGKRA